jgi:hypothetical protein
MSRSRDRTDRPRTTGRSPTLNPPPSGRIDIASYVPSRSVETWEMWLCGAHKIDEQTEHKAAFRREVEQGTMSARKAVEAWFVLLTPEEQQAEESLLPALAHGRKEMARLQGFAKR